MTDNKNIKYFYIREKADNIGNFKHRGNPVACVASLLQRDTGLAKVHYGLSVLNSSDNEGFDKVRSREIAKGRLLKNPEVLHLTGKVTSIGIVKAILEQISDAVFLPNCSGPDDNDNYGRMPNRVKDAAYVWLHGVDPELEEFLRLRKKFTGK